MHIVRGIENQRPSFQWFSDDLKARGIGRVDFLRVKNPVPIIVVGFRRQAQALAHEKLVLACSM